MKLQFYTFKLAVHRTIGARLLFQMLGMILIALIGISYLFYKVLQEQTEQSIITNLDTQAKYIEAQLTQIEQAMYSLAMSVSTMYESLTEYTLEDYKQLAFNFYLNRPNLVVGTGFGQTPYKIITNRQGFWHYFYTDPKHPEAVGENLPPPYNYIRYVDLLISDNYFTQNYYTLPVNQRKAMWTDSYKWHAITMVSFLSPIFSKNNELLGIAGADIDVTELTRQLQTLLNPEQSYYVLLTDRGDLLSYPPLPEKAVNIESYQQVPEISAIWKILHRKNKGFTHYNGNFWAYQRIANTQWLMLVSIPESQLILSVVKITSLGVFIIGGFLIFITTNFIHQLNQRLQLLSDECERLINNISPLAVQPLTVSNKNMDKVELLSHSFFYLTKQIEQYLLQLEEEIRRSTHELQQKNDLFLKLDQEKNNLLELIDRDLRTSLSEILVLSQAIQENIDTLSTQDILQFNHGIEQNSKKMYLLINELLHANAIETGKFKCVLGFVNLVSILENLCANYNKIAQTKGIVVKFEKPVEQYIAWIDEHLAEQILDNLLSNAIKYSPFGKKVFVKIYRDESMIYCDIQDQGQGLSNLDQTKLFNKFTRLTPQPTNKEHSIGMGLFIVKKLIETLNGQVWCKSQLNQGTIFTVAFPTSPAMNS